MLERSSFMEPERECHRGARGKKGEGGEISRNEKEKEKEKNLFYCGSIKADQFLSSIVGLQQSSLTIETPDGDKICITFQGAEIDVLQPLQNSF